MLSFNCLCTFLLQFPVAVTIAAGRKWQIRMKMSSPRTSAVMLAFTGSMASMAFRFPGFNSFGALPTMTAHLPARERKGMGYNSLPSLRWNGSFPLHKFIYVRVWVCACVRRYSYSFVFICPYSIYLRPSISPALSIYLRELCKLSTHATYVIYEIYIIYYEWSMYLCNPCNLWCQYTLSMHMTFTINENYVIHVFV